MDDLTPLNTDHKQVITVLENSALSTRLGHKSTIIKYTKLPHFVSKAPWSHQNYFVHPRLRRIVTLDEQPIETTRSLKQNLSTPINMSSINGPKRKIKIITIEDDADSNYYTKLSKDVKKTVTKTTNRATEANYSDGKSQCSQKTISRVTGSTKFLYSRETKHHLRKSKDIKSNESEIEKQNLKQLDNKQIRTAEIDKIIKSIHLKEKDIQEEGHMHGKGYLTFSAAQTDQYDQRNVTPTEDTSRSAKKANKSSKICLNKNLIVSVEQGKETLATKKHLIDDIKSNVSTNKNNKLHLKNSHNHHNKLEFGKDVLRKNKPVTVIHVPLDETPKKQPEKENRVYKIDCTTEVNNTRTLKDISVETEPTPTRINQGTEIDISLDTLCNEIDGNIEVTNVINEKFETLNIPKVSLKKESNDLTKKKVVNLYSTSLPNLKTPSIDVISMDNDNCKADSRVEKNSSYIVGTATVTYTREQKIDFHVVEKNEEITTNLCSTSLAYPLNVVSIFKNELNKRNSRDRNSKKRNKSELDSKYSNDLSSVNWPHGESDSGKLVKPSDIISTIRVNNHFLKSDYISEQFQRELNFIDSFFESLQYLEKLSERCFTEANADSLTYNKPFEANSSEYVTHFTKIENGLNVDDNETMATKSLCQLNLLIHNEQRRARDFLFVLKMQEDVLKDYIKSQMLWLEKKKKQDNTDISALKKKQRGALLKLQHECGEMQRMRKALLTLSEKRKVALMRTKKNIEMKLKNDVNVEQILLGKKKLKRSPSSERCLTPIKCFELSSSGCEDTTTSRPKSDCAWYSSLVVDTTLNLAEKSVTSAEKSIQTGDSILAVDPNNHTQATVAENCIVVDGGYLNILFQNLSLPQIFSGGKQYEVNEEALKNIVNSSNTRSNISNDTDVIERFIEHVKNQESESSSSASTAHSLVEEFDQFYKCLDDDDKSLTNSPDSELKECTMQSNNQPECDHSTSLPMENEGSLLKRLSEMYGVEHSYVCEPSAVTMEVQNNGATLASVAGPLPVPAGEPAFVDNQTTDLSQWTVTKTSNDAEGPQNDQVFSSNITPMPQYSSPVLYEAEELRRQQLAIEREIKALEQQQCLLVVREIPDKPPPPYTPPSETRTSKLPRMFLKDGITEEKIHKHFLDLSTDIFDTSDPFDGFIKDFCEESIERQQSGISDKPWDTYNLLPHRPQPDTKKMVEKTCTDLKEVLSGVTPAYVSGVGSRRTDHIDDILFAEWRRCEPEWTSLHTDEALVKNQLFESIFHKILNETIGEYKRIVCNDKSTSEQ